jgi:uncharacterized protein
MFSDDHRPWPAPRSPWLLRQVWQNVLLAHWPVPVESMRVALPPPLRPHLDTFNRTAWLGIIGFRATGTRMHGLPVIPGLSAFIELNVRTYVTLENKPGVHFFSLDTVHLLACAGARAFYSLPYFPASTEFHDERGGHLIRSARWRPGRAVFEARYEPFGPPLLATADPFTNFVAERYCLYSVGARQKVVRGEIHHQPWELYAARADIRRNSMAIPLGLELEGRPRCHFSDHQEAFIWPPALLPDRALVNA